MTESLGPNIFSARHIYSFIEIAPNKYNMTLFAFHIEFLQLSYFFKLPLYVGRAWSDPKYLNHYLSYRVHRRADG